MQSHMVTLGIGRDKDWEQWAVYQRNNNHSTERGGVRAFIVNTVNSEWLRARFYSWQSYLKML